MYNTDPNIVGEGAESSEELMEGFGWSILPIFN